MRRPSEIRNFCYSEAMKQGATLIQLSGRGQVTLPADVRKALSLHTGDAFQVHVEDGRIVLEPVEVAPVDLYTEERIQEFLDSSELSKDELAQARKAWGV